MKLKKQNTKQSGIQTTSGIKAGECNGCQYIGNDQVIGYNCTDCPNPGAGYPGDKLLCTGNATCYDNGRGGTPGGNECHCVF